MLLIGETCAAFLGWAQPGATLVLGPVVVVCLSFVPYCAHIDYAGKQANTLSSAV